MSGRLHARLVCFTMCRRGRAWAWLATCLWASYKRRYGALR